MKEDMGITGEPVQDISPEMKEANRLIQESLFPTESGSSSAGKTVSTTAKTSLLGFCELLKQVYDDTAKHYEKISLKHFRSASTARKKERTELMETCNKAAEWSIKVVSRSKNLQKYFADTKNFKERGMILPEFGLSLEVMMEYTDAVLAPIMAKAVADTASSQHFIKKLEKYIQATLDRKDYLRKPSTLSLGIDEQLMNDFKRALVDMPKEDMQEVMKEIANRRNSKEAFIALIRDVVSKQKSMGIMEQFQMKVLKYMQPERRDKLKSLLNKIPKKNHAGLMREMMSIRDNMVDSKLKEIDELKKKK